MGWSTLEKAIHKWFEGEGQSCCGSPGALACRHWRSSSRQGWSRGRALLVFGVGQQSQQVLIVAPTRGHGLRSTRP